MGQSWGREWLPSCGESHQPVLLGRGAARPLPSSAPRGRAWHRGSEARETARGSAKWTSPPQRCGRGFSDPAGNASPTRTARAGTRLRTLEVEPEAHATPALRGSSTEEGDGRLTRADTPRAAAECAAAEPATDAHLIEVRAGSPGRGALLTSCWPLGPHPAYCSFALLTSGGSRL